MANTNWNNQAEAAAIDHLIQVTKADKARKECARLLAAVAAGKDAGEYVSPSRPCGK